MATRTYSIAPETHNKIITLAKYLEDTQSGVIKEAIQDMYERYLKEIGSAVPIPEEKEKINVEDIF